MPRTRACRLTSHNAHKAHLHSPGPWGTATSKLTWLFRRYQSEMWPLLTKTAVPDCDEMVHSHLEFSCCQLHYFENGFQNDSYSYRQAVLRRTGSEQWEHGLVCLGLGTAPVVCRVLAPQQWRCSSPDVTELYVWFPPGRSLLNKAVNAILGTPCLSPCNFKWNY